MTSVNDNKSIFLLFMNKRLQFLRGTFCTLKKIKPSSKKGVFGVFNVFFWHFSDDGGYKESHISEQLLIQMVVNQEKKKS